MPIIFPSLPAQRSNLRFWRGYHVIKDGSKNSKKSNHKALKEKTRSSQSFDIICFVFLCEKFFACFVVKKLIFRTAPY